MMPNGESREHGRERRRWWRCWSILDVLRELKQGVANVLLESHNTKAILRRFETSTGERLTALQLGQDGLATMLRAIAKQEAKQMATNQEILAKVSGSSTVIDSVKVLLDAMRAEGDPVIRQQIFDAATANDDKLRALLTDNTPTPPSDI